MGPHDGWKDLALVLLIKNVGPPGDPELKMSCSKGKGGDERMVGLVPFVRPSYHRKTWHRHHRKHRATDQVHMYTPAGVHFMR